MRMRSSELKAGFLAFWKRHRVQTVPSFPLLRADRKLLFVNAGITPFLPLIRVGCHLDTTALVQKCLRTRWDDPGSFRFEMMTIVGMADSLEHVVRLLFQWLESEARLDHGALHAVFDPADWELHNLVLGHLPTNRLHALIGNNDAYWTRWQFGFGDELVGRGLTFAWERPFVNPCSSACGIFCQCARFLSLGNIVMIHCATTSQSYFDIGFGLERLASVFHDGDAGKLDPLTPILQQWLSARLAPGEISSLTHYFQAVFLLKEEGINAGNKAAHYVLRKLIRRIVEVVFPVSLIGARSEMATLLEELARAYESHLSAQVRAAIQQEFDREIVRIAKGLELGKSRARRFLCRRRWSSGEDLGHRLQDTFGLPPTVVDELLAEWQKHACE